MVEWNAEYTEFIPPSQIFASVETGYCGWLYVPTLDMDESYPIKVAFQVPELAQPLNVVSVYVKADTKIREIFEELKKQKQVFDPENYELLKLEDGALVLEETVYFYKIKRDTPLILAPKTCPKTIQIIDKDKLKELQVHSTDSIQYINLLLKYKFYKENVELVSTSTKERLSENSLLLDYEGAGIETLSFSVKPKFLHKAEAEPREVTSVPFATNRKEHFWYSTDFSQFLTGSLKYGLCNLQEKKESAVELDLKLVNQRDFKEHDFDRIEVQKVSVLPDPSFFANADEGLDFLLFVHGYNVSFQSVVRRTAQIASNFNFHGRVGCYSWPSQGLEVSYLFDGKNVKNAFPYFMEFLELLTKNLPAGGKLHIISHSMGNRLTTRAVELLATDKPEKRNDYNQIIEKLGNLVFAAPDVSQTEFKNRLEAFYRLDIAREKVNTTVYTCDSDKALLLSKGVNLNDRFNDRFGRVPVPIDYVSVFEVTPPANESITSLNHSYIYVSIFFQEFIAFLITSHFNLKGMARSIRTCKEHN